MVHTVPNMGQGCTHSTMLTDNLVRARVSIPEIPGIFLAFKNSSRSFVAPVACSTRFFENNNSFTSWNDRFVIITVNSIISHQRISKGQDLSIIRLVCNGFLVTGHTCIKDDFACYINICSEGLAFKTVPSSNTRSLLSYFHLSWTLTGVF